MPPPDRDPAREPEIATGTLAEIYAQQGLFDRALEIYRRIARRRPDDPAVRSRIEALEAAREEAGAEAAPEEPAPEEPAPEEPAPEEPAPEEPAPEGGPSPLEADEAFRRWLESR